jgi:transcriptional regulator with XRE-family HTH domain
MVFCVVSWLRVRVGHISGRSFDTGEVMSADRSAAAPSFLGQDDAPVGATVLRMLLGAQLRRFREAAGLTAERAGFEIRASRSKISRMETGRAGFKTRDVSGLLTLYGVIDERERARLLALAAQSSGPDWWVEYSDILPGWFESYLGLESAAAIIRSFEIQFVPGLFQTEEYARAVIQLGGRPTPAAEVERLVNLRVKRQELLARVDPPRIWSVLDEGVLRRPVGGPAVLRAQLRHLSEVANMPHVTLQVVPFDRGGHAGAGEAFTVLRFTEQDLPDVVYIEQLAGAVYLDRRWDVEPYLDLMDRLSSEALSPAATMRFIEQVTWKTQALMPSRWQTREQHPGDEQRGDGSRGGGELIELKAYPHASILSPGPAEEPTLAVAIYLSDEGIHGQVEAAVDAWLASAGLMVEERDEPIIGSWFRRMRAGVKHSVRTPAAQDALLTAAHAVDTRMVLAQDAVVTATLLQGVAPVIASLQPTKDAVVRAGAVLIVKIDWAVQVHQLTAAQQVMLNHQPQLLSSPAAIIAALQPNGTNGNGIASEIK